MKRIETDVETELAELLAAFDTELAKGNPRSQQLEDRLRFAPAEVRRRFDRAQACLLLIDRAWPRGQRRPERA